LVDVADTTATALYTTDNHVVSAASRDVGLRAASERRERRWASYIHAAQSTVP
jgi:hypothetical protein